MGIVGDVHGNVAALAGLLRLVEHRYDHLVLVGDYVNRGTQSAAVVELLVNANDPSRFTLLAGNHDKALLACLEAGELNRFLRIGGAATIRSYIEGDVEADVLRQLRDVVPAPHRELLRSLRDSYHRDGLLITHDPKDWRPGGFHVYGHVPQRGLKPVVTRTSAAIDTGCGTLADGRLSCLGWPSLEVTQVDIAGREISP